MDNKSVLYDVLFFWDNTQDNLKYKQYCAETLCNILKINSELSVKLVYESEEKGKCLIYSTHDINIATDIRNTLIALELNCQICPLQVADLFGEQSCQT